MRLLGDDGESRDGNLLVQVVAKGRKFGHDTGVEVALPENVFTPKYSHIEEGAGGVPLSENPDIHHITPLQTLV